MDRLTLENLSVVRLELREKRFEDASSLLTVERLLDVPRQGLLNRHLSWGLMWRRARSAGLKHDRMPPAVGLDFMASVP
jgi:hypothetical protein